MRATRDDGVDVDLHSDGTWTEAAPGHPYEERPQHSYDTWVSEYDFDRRVVTLLRVEEAGIGDWRIKTGRHTHSAAGSSTAAHLPEQRRGQDGAPHRRHDLDRAEHRHTINSGEPKELHPTLDTEGSHERACGQRRLRRGTTQTPAARADCS